MQYIFHQFINMVFLEHLDPIPIYIQSRILDREREGDVREGGNG